MCFMLTLHIAHLIIELAFISFVQMDTNRMLAWVKNVKETHGSVEVNALAQVEAINSRGFYMVGNFNNKDNLKVLYWLFHLVSR